MKGGSRTSERLDLNLEEGIRLGKNGSATCTDSTGRRAPEEEGAWGREEDRDRKGTAMEVDEKHEGYVAFTDLARRFEADQVVKTSQSRDAFSSTAYLALEPIGNATASGVSYSFSIDPLLQMMDMRTLSSLPSW
jgi:hypothetical protein